MVGRSVVSWFASQQERRRLRSPFCNPDIDPVPGQVLAVSIWKGTASLWDLFVARSALRHDTRDFVKDARSSEDDARRLVLRELGALRPSALRETLRLEAVLVAQEEGLRALSGRSFGLAQALAFASYTLNAPLRRNVVALGTIEPDGRVGTVDEVPAKLAGIQEHAVCVDTLLVAHEQDLPETRLTVQRVGSVFDALKVALALDLAERVVTSCTEDGAHALADALFSLAVRDVPHVLNWAALAQVAGRLETELPAGSLVRWKTQVARAIANRHEGGSDRFATDFFEELPAELRLEMLAQAVQAATDGCDVETEAIEERAEREARAFAGFSGANKIWGALGRLRAAWHRHEEALEDLERATQGWSALLLVHEASYAMCERVRLLGALGRAQALRELLAGDFERVWSAPNTSNRSRAFLALAAGRALLDVDDPEAARPWLAEEHWATAHVEQGRARQRRRLGEDVALEGVNRVLSRLDLGDAQALPELRALKTEEYDRLAGLVEGPAQVARWWRY